MNVVVIEERIYILFENYYQLTELMNSDLSTDEILLEVYARTHQEFKNLSELSMYLNSIKKQFLALIEQLIVSEKLTALDGEALLKLIKST